MKQATHYQSKSTRLKRTIYLTITGGWIPRVLWETSLKWLKETPWLETEAISKRAMLTKFKPLTDKMRRLETSNKSTICLHSKIYLIRSLHKEKWRLINLQCKTDRLLLRRGELLFQDSTSSKGSLQQTAKKDNLIDPPARALIKLMIWILWTAIN